MSPAHIATPIADFRTLRVFETEHGARSSLDRHAHTIPYLSLVLRGGYTERVGSRAVQCDTLRVRFHPAGEEHANQFGSTGATCINFELHDWWEEELVRLGLAEPADLLVSTRSAWVGLRMEQEARAGGPASCLVLEELTARLLSDATRVQREGLTRASRPRLRLAMDFIRDHPTSDFSLSAVADACGLHPTHLARAFKRAVGMTVGEYARQTRVLWAQDALLKHPQWPLSRVAIEAGFADHAHFSRVFSATTGTAPSNIRRALRPRLLQR